MTMRLGGVSLGLVASAALAAWILIPLKGWDYYRTPIAIRGYALPHKVLRPSGPAGQSFGMAGVVLILVPFLYMMRKRVKRLRSAGSLRTWLEVHLFCGIVGPALITFHTSFKFNGIVSAAYWAMVIVMASGFVGRYLYVRIPRTLRGTELTRVELDSQAEALHNELVAAVGQSPLLERVAALERSITPGERARRSFIGLMFGEIGVRRRIRAFARDVRRTTLPADRQQALVHLIAERSFLLRRIAYLQKTKAVFDLWHVFHLPLVYLLLVIVAAHVSLALYLGYVPFRW